MEYGKIQGACALQLLWRLLWFPSPERVTTDEAAGDLVLHWPLACNDSDHDNVCDFSPTWQ